MSRRWRSIGEPLPLGLASEIATPALQQSSARR